VYIGIFGGTFNPVHFGHLRSAEEICDRFKMKEVVFIPSAIPPHKSRSDIEDPVHRLKMVNLAVTGNPYFTVSEIEIHRKGKSYSIDTIRQIKKNCPSDDLAFIMGIDAFLEIHTWHKYKQIFSECDFIITSRPGAPKRSFIKSMPDEVLNQFKRKKNGRIFEHESGKKVHFTEVTDLDISASSLRSIVRNKRTLRYLTPRRVIDYIKENKLYM
jgi:nicotinate-nucleotide adenylyltransferase